MEQKKNGASLVFKLLITFGAVLLIVGLFIPVFKFKYSGIDFDFGKLGNKALSMLGMEEKDLEEMYDASIEAALKEEDAKTDAEIAETVMRELLDEEQLDIDEDDYEYLEEQLEDDLGKNIKSGYSYISNYKFIDTYFGQKNNTFKLIVLIAVIVLALAAVIFAWVNLPVVSMITSILSAGVGIGYSLFRVLKKLAAEYSDNSLGIELKCKFIFKFGMNVGFFIIIAGGVVLLVSSIILMAVSAKAKKAVVDSVSGTPSYDNFPTPPQPGFSQSGQTPAYPNFQEEQNTVPLVDVAETVTMPQPQSVSSQGTITTGVQILDGSMKGVKIPIEDNATLNVGKDPQMAQLVMDKSFLSVSRLHCTISYSAASGHYFVTDNSSNGTFKSDGTRLMKGKKMSVPRQTILYLATDACKIKLL